MSTSVSTHTLSCKLTETEYQIIEDYGWHVWREAKTAAANIDGGTVTISIHDFYSAVSDGLGAAEDHPAIAKRILGMLDSVKASCIGRQEDATFMSDIKKMKDVALRCFDRLPTSGISGMHSDGSFETKAIVAAEGEGAEMIVHIIGIAGGIVNGLLLDVRPDETTGYWYYPEMGNGSVIAAAADAVVSDYWFSMPASGKAIALIGDASLAIQLLESYPMLFSWEYVGPKGFAPPGDLS